MSVLLQAFFCHLFLRLEMMKGDRHGSVSCSGSTAGEPYSQFDQHQETGAMTAPFCKRLANWKDGSSTKSAKCWVWIHCNMRDQRLNDDPAKYEYILLRRLANFSYSTVRNMRKRLNRKSSTTAHRAQSA